MIIAGIETLADSAGHFSYALFSFPYGDKPYWKIAVFNAISQFQMGYLKNKKGKEVVYLRKGAAENRIKMLIA